MRRTLAVGVGLMVSCGFAAASQGPTGASAEPDGGKPIVTQWTLPDDYEAAIFAYQEATQPYVSEISAALHDTPGWSGLQLDLDAKTIQVYVAGSIPSSLTALAEKAPLGLTVSVTKSEYSHDYLAKFVQEVFAADKRVVGVSIPVDGSGLRVGVDLPQEEFGEAVTRIQSELSASVALAMFHDEGGGLYAGRTEMLLRFGVGHRCSTRLPANRPVRALRATLCATEPQGTLRCKRPSTASLIQVVRLITKLPRAPWWGTPLSITMRSTMRGQ